MAAFDNGLALGADGLELDVRLSRDGVVVVHHDRHARSHDQPPGAVASLDRASWRGSTPGAVSPRDGIHPFRGQGIGVPTLASVLARLPRRAASSSR